MCAGARSIRTERAVGIAGGYLLACCPEYCRLEVGVCHGVNILERYAGLCSGLILVAPEEGHELGTGHVAVGSKMRAVNAVGYALSDCPENGGVIGVILAVCLLCGYVNKGIFRRLGFGFACRSPQEGHDLRAGAVLVGCEYSVAVAGGDTLGGRPLYRVGKGQVSAFGVNVGEFNRGLVVRILFAADGAYAVLVVMAESRNGLALLDNFLANGANLIAGVTGLGAGCVLRTYKLSLMAECGDGLTLFDDFFAYGTDYVAGITGLGAGWSYGRVRGWPRPFR